MCQNQKKGAGIEKETVRQKGKKNEQDAILGCQNFYTQRRVCTR